MYMRLEAISPPSQVGLSWKSQIIKMIMWKSSQENLPSKFGQNWISNSLDIANIEFTVMGGWVGGWAGGWMVVVV